MLQKGPLHVNLFLYPCMFPFVPLNVPFCISPCSSFVPSHMPLCTLTCSFSYPLHVPFCTFKYSYLHSSDLLCSSLNPFVFPGPTFGPHEFLFYPVYVLFSTSQTFNMQTIKKWPICWVSSLQNADKYLRSSMVWIFDMFCKMSTLSKPCWNCFLHIYNQLHLKMKVTLSQPK